MKLIFKVAGCIFKKSCVKKYYCWLCIIFTKNIPLNGHCCHMARNKKTDLSPPPFPIFFPFTLLLHCIWRTFCEKNFFEHLFQNVPSKGLTQPAKPGSYVIYNEYTMLLLLHLFTSLALQFKIFRSCLQLLAFTSNFPPQRRRISLKILTFLPPVLLSRLKNRVFTRPIRELFPVT